MKSLGETIARQAERIKVLELALTSCIQALQYAEVGKLGTEGVGIPIEEAGVVLQGEVKPSQGI